MPKLNKVQAQDTKFTRVFNEVIQDPSLSWKARGIFIYLWSLPDNWMYRETEIKNHATDGRASLRSGLDELEKRGYLKRKTTHNAHLQFGQSQWLLSDRQMFDFPTSGHQTSGHQTSDNRTLQTTNITNHLSGQTTKQTKERDSNSKFLENEFQKYFVTPPTVKVIQKIHGWVANPNYNVAAIDKAMATAKDNCNTGNPNAIASYINSCLKYPAKRNKSKSKSKSNNHVYRNLGPVKRTAQCIAIHRQGGNPFAEYTTADMDIAKVMLSQHLNAHSDAEIKKVKSMLEMRGVIR